MSEPAHPLDIAVRGLCPRCGAKTLFAGVARFAGHCRACGLDYSGFNVGDGPAAFLVMIIGAVVTGAAIGAELSLHPPFWLHMLVWMPLTVALVMGALRVAKALLLTFEYRNAAREGRIAPNEPPPPGP